jgi:iron complex outermembrane receptor protein
MRIRCSSARSALMFTGILVTTTLHAEDAAAPATASGGAASNQVVEEVVVTGSYIRGTPEDAALPVDVITAESLEEQGDPNIIQLIQRIPSMAGGNIGESNRFLGTAAQGTATVNLRGLGITRTLVLMNGQRMSKHTAAGGAEFVDVSQVPLAAIGRVEVLRDGAAVTYGSDAVGGVVNFITRKDLEGFEVGGSFTEVQDSDGDYDMTLAYGWNNDSGNILFAADYARKSEIRLYDINFMRPMRPGQGDGISGAGNPGTYFTIANPVDTDGDGFFDPGTRQGTAFRDLGCDQLGTFVISATSCAYPFNWQESPVNDEKRYHLFGEVNWEFNESLRFHFEGLYAYTLIPHNRVSVTLSSTQFPTPIEASGGSPGGGTSPFPAVGGELQSRFYIPPTNPGLVSLMTGGGCPFTAAICTAALTSGLITSQTGWRPGAMGGSPLKNGDTDPQKTRNNAYRLSGGFDGDFENGWGWTTRMTYAHDVGRVNVSDLTVNRVQLGLRGLGGAGCNPLTGTPGAGPCEWFNPFANSITRSIVNHQSYAEAVGRPQGPANTASLWGWMRDTQTIEITSELFTAEAVLTGDMLGTFELPGGEIEWVVGTQWRWERRLVDPSTNADPSGTPCVDSPPYGDGFPTCGVPGVGPFLFLSPSRRNDLDQDIPSVFAEVKVPILESLEAGIAGRYEDYGGEVGSTNDYRVSLRWEPLSWLVLRGSTGTTFRAPPLAAVDPSSGRIQAQFTNPTSGAQLYRPQDVFGNAQLKPETADTYNFGVIVATEDLELFDFVIGRFDASIDYFDVTFQDEITGETGARVYGTMFPSANPTTWACANAPLKDRFTFTTSLATNNTDYNGTAPGGVFPECHPDNFLGLKTILGNGREDTEIRGLDLALTWTRDGIFGGELSVGGDATYLHEWTRGNQYLVGTDVIFDAATDRAGTAELLSGFFSYPEWRANGHVNYRHGDHNVHLMAHYYDDVRDRNRSSPNVKWVHRGSHSTLDLTYQVNLPWETRLTASVFNFLDAQPPYIRSQFNYDYATYSPLGRTFKLGFLKQF